VTTSSKSRIYCSTDLSVDGKQFGELQLRHSDNRQSLGYYPVPIITIANGKGPTALLIAGIHGDEFEGPAALMRLAHSLGSSTLTGRVIIVPAVNMPAVEVRSRISPLDHVNMNRSFPGDPDGGPTAQLAYYVEQELIAKSDLVIDIHCGGNASVFAPCALPNRSAVESLFQSNMALANVFGAPLVWMLNSNNDNRSVNAAADRKGVPMIAAELGGGGGCELSMVELAQAGITRCLQHAGILSGKPEDYNEPHINEPRVVEIASPAQSLFAPFRGLFDRHFQAGDVATAGDIAGSMISLEEPDREPVLLRFAVDGIVLAHSNRGYVENGDMLGMIATDVNLSGGPVQ